MPGTCCPSRAPRSEPSRARLRRHHLLPPLPRRRRRRLRRRAGRGPAGRRRRGRGRLAGRRPPLRDRLRRRDHPEPAARSRGSSLRCRCSSSGSREPRDAPPADADVVHAHWLPSALAGARSAAGRSCCRSGGPTSSLPAGRPGSSARSFAGRGSSSPPRPSWREPRPSSGRARCG